jgi:hypothetical protein
MRQLRQRATRRILRALALLCSSAPAASGCSLLVSDLPPAPHDASTDDGGPGEGASAAGDGSLGADGTPTETGSGNCCDGSCIQGDSNAACGPTCKVCSGGSQCVEGQCAIYVGNSSAFSPCNVTTFAGLQTGFLFSFAVSAPAMTATTLGIIGNSSATGISGILALYGNSSGGAGPSGLIASVTLSGAIKPGKNEGSIGAISLPAGTYWLAAEFNGQAQICADTSTGNQVYYERVGYGTVPTVFLNDSHSPQAGADFNLYLVGTQ